MQGEDCSWIKQIDWTYTEPGIHIEVWESSREDLLYIEDRYAKKHGMYQQPVQATLDDFSSPRYAVHLDRNGLSYGTRILDTFEQEREAAAYLRQLTYPG